jgi:epoxyqueuosine reductase
MIWTGSTATEELISQAKILGFIAVGLSSPSQPAHFDKFTSWLAAHKNADMAWLERNLHLRENPSLLLEGCRTIISLAYPYSSRKPCTADGMTVARFSRPDQDDYHNRVRRLAGKLASILKGHDAESKSRICIDSAPILERSIACSTGLGFIGKNNMLIIPGFGSYFYLAEILTSTELDIPQVQTMESRCGACTRCMDACPMGALESPFTLNAPRCLSYQTIECKGKVNDIVAGKMGNCFFGCDRCQEACPYNDQSETTEQLLPSSEEILNMEEDEFMEKFGRTSFKRTGLEKLKSNISAMKGAK